MRIATAFRQWTAACDPGTFGCLESLLWALADDDVAARLADGTTKMRPQDWQSGDQPWVAEVIAHFGGAEEMIKDTKANVFADRELKYLVTTGEGKEMRGA